MGYNSETNTITRDYRFETADDAENGDQITQQQMDFALDDIVEDVNLMARDFFEDIDAFNSVFLGASSTNPTVDGDGNPIQAGALYVNTFVPELRFYNGSSWTPAAQSQIVIDNFTGDGARTAFALGTNPQSEKNIFVHIDGVYQNKDAFSLSNADLVFSEAPPDGAVIEALLISITSIGQTSADLVSNADGGTVQDFMRKKYVFTNRDSESFEKGKSLGLGVVWWANEHAYINETGGEAGEDLGVSDISAVAINNKITTSQFGISGTGDETDALGRAFSAARDGVQLIVDQSASFGSQITVPASSGGAAWVDGAVLTYTREQDSGGLAVQSAIAYTGTRGAVFSNPTIRYTGTFDHGLSYDGLVHGLYLIDCDNVTVFGGSIEGFNNSGIFLGALARNENNLCKNNRIINVNSSRNRVSGCNYSFQEDLLISGGCYEENGIVTDAATGYGIDAGSETLNVRVVIDGVTTYRNFRKGIDIHDGGSFTIVNCHMIEDRLFSFDAQSKVYDFTSLIFANNVIEVDPSFTTALQQTFYAIEVQINPSGQAGKGVGSPHIIIDNITIKGIGSDVAATSVRPIVIVHGGTTTANYKITNVVCDGAKVDVVAYVTCKAHAAGTLFVDMQNCTFDLTQTTSLLEILPASVDVTMKSQGNRYDIPSVTSWLYTYADANIDFDNNTLNGDMIEKIQRSGKGSTRRKVVSKDLSAGVAADMFIVSKLSTSGFYEIKYAAAISSGGDGAVRGGVATFVGGFFTAAAGKRGVSAVTQTDTAVNLPSTAPVLTWTVVLSGTNFIARVQSDISCSITAEMFGVSGLDETVSVA